MNVSKGNMFLVFDTAYDGKGIQTFFPNCTNTYQLPVHSVLILSETERSIKSWSDLGTYSCTLTWLYSLVVHYCRSVVVIRNKLSEGPKHLNTLMKSNAIDFLELFLLDLWNLFTANTFYSSERSHAVTTNKHIKLYKKVSTEATQADYIFTSPCYQA